jgi:hypothetical protein
MRKPTGPRTSASSGLGMVLLPFIAELGLLALISVGLPISGYAAVGIAVLIGFIFLERATGLHAAWLAPIYVPVMWWLVAKFAGLLGYFFGLGVR